MALAFWADGLTPRYLEDALVRALGLAEPPHLISQLADEEYEALENAEQLDSAAEVKRTAADLDEAAANAARADADRIRRERLAAESALRATEEEAAKVEAGIQAQAARDTRAVAADAEGRRRPRQAEGTPRRSTKPRSDKKK